MPLACILLLAPTTSHGALTSKLLSVYPEATPSIDDRVFYLSQNYWRTVPATDAEQSNPPPRKILQSITVSSIPALTLLHISPEIAGETPKNTLAVSEAEHFDPSSLHMVLGTKLNTLWQPVKQLDIHIPEPLGSTWDMGLFRVRIGEVHAMKSAAGPAGLRGIIVAVTWMILAEQVKSMEEEAEEEGITETTDELHKRLITQFCENLGMKDAQQTQVIEEYWGVTDIEEGLDGDWESEVDLWCRVLSNKVLTGVQGARRWDVMDVWTKTGSSPAPTAGIT